MDTSTGEWIMLGCSRDDPQCLHNPGDLLDMIRQIGFLPLFSNGIPGFSVEEHTPGDDWWTDDPATDPWAWRQILASRDEVAYGKFFDRKAGFVSREMFPDFANYRRDGYDYEGLYEDGKLKRRSRQIMDAFEPDEQMKGLALLSCDARRKAAVEKGFEGAVTDLQMQTFLIAGGFRQKVNRQGIPYGWHVSVLMTPETKWGYAWVNERSVGKPSESWRLIRDRIRRFYPNAAEKEIRRVLGIR